MLAVALDFFLWDFIKDEASKKFSELNEMKSAAFEAILEEQVKSSRNLIAIHSLIYLLSMFPCLL